MTRILLALCVLLASTLPADAGLFRRKCRARAACQVAAPVPCGVAVQGYAPAIASAQATVAVVAAPDASGDPYGFTDWLNARRAENHRLPVKCDPGLSGQAAMNNSYGYGHHYMGNARRQNAGMGSAATVWQMWMASPAHQSALLDPTITVIGIAANGQIWTFNAY